MHRSVDRENANLALASLVLFARREELGRRSSGQTWPRGGVDARLRQQLPTDPEA